MNNALAIFFSPGKVFANLKGMERPAWQVPFIIVLIAVALSTAFTISVTQGSEEVMMRQEEALRERDLSDEQIEQALAISRGPVPMIIYGVLIAVATTLIFLLFALILNLFLPALGGIQGYRMIFSVICHAAMVIVPAAILRIILLLITQSPYVSTSLALVAPGIEKTSFLWFLLGSFDFFVIWEMILVAMGIAITRDIKKTSAYVLVYAIWIVWIFASSGLFSMLQGPR